MYVIPRCGHPTGDWCEHCNVAAPDLPSHALCSGCDASLRMCRLCRLELQLRKGPRIPTVRQAPGSAWNGASQCANCGKRQSGLKLCSGCRCVRYCSLTCQRLDWKPTHKPLCAFLKELQPLSFVYEWHMNCARRAAAYRPELLLPISGDI